MSYEGYYEYLCPEGHCWNVDATEMIYSDNKQKVKYRACPTCQQQALYECSVDLTNGYYPDEPETFDGPKEEIGWTDVPQQDHCGNKYFSKAVKYRPVLESGRWKELHKDGQI